MDEFKRVIRFALPGIACITELIIFVLIADSSKLTNLFQDKNSNWDGIGLAFGTVIASGGLGYIFSNIYWGFYWWLPFQRYLAIDHTKLFYDLRDKIEIPNNNMIQQALLRRNLSRRDAWVMGTLLLTERDKFPNEVLKRIVDMTHSLGAFIVGNIFVLISWMAIHDWNRPNAKFWAIIISIIWLILLILFVINRQATLKQHQELVGSEIYRIINTEYSDKCEKVKLYYRN
jgi:hypothetical protein